jgi:biotin carboxyl carrier protein
MKLVVALSCVAAGCASGNEGSPAPEQQTGAPAPAAAGALRLTGVVEAVRSRTVSVPRLRGASLAPMVITYLIPAGTRVEPGDLLVVLDRQEQELLAFTAQAELIDLDGQIAKKRADQRAAEAKDMTELVAARNDVARARLAVQTNDLIARVAAEKYALALEQAEARLAQLEATYRLKREAAAADLEILVIRRERSARALERALGNAELMDIRAPFPGLAVVKTLYRSGTGMAQIVEGDEVRPGQALVDIVDTSEMQVRARVNQADAEFVHPGQRATVRLDGFPELEFEGVIDQVTPLAVTSAVSDKVRTLTAIVAIRGRQDALLPDLTASVEVLPAGVAPAVAGAGSKPGINR